MFLSKPVRANALYCGNAPAPPTPPLPPTPNLHVNIGQCRTSGLLEIKVGLLKPFCMQALNRNGWRKTFGRRSSNLRPARAMDVNFKPFSTIEARAQFGRCGPQIWTLNSIKGTVEFRDLYLQEGLPGIFDDFKVSGLGVWDWGWGSRWRI